MEEAQAALNLVRSSINWLDVAGQLHLLNTIANMLLLAGLLAFAGWLPLALAQDVCISLSATSCLEQPANACHYDFAVGQCYSGAARDTCQLQNTTQACTTAGCFYDPYLVKCLTSLSQVRWAFSCPYWGASNWWTADAYGQGIVSPACQYHGCAFDKTAKTCAEITQAGPAPTTQSQTVYSQTVQFLNPVVRPNSLVFTVDVRATVVQNPNTPEWPIIEILSPRAGLAAWSTVVNSTCSSFSSAAAAGPVPFVGTAYSTGSLVANFSQFQFLDNGMHRFFGYMLVGGGSLVESVVTDGTWITYTVAINLTKLIAECSTRGATAAESLNGRVYTVPLSYVERGIGGAFLQTTKIFDVLVQTTGQIAIGTAAPYHQRAFPLEVVYMPSDCGSSTRARQRIAWQITVQDQFNPNQIAGPRTIADLSIAGGSNCFGDELVAFERIGCSSAQASCSFQFVTQSKCRTKGSDGQTFNLCSHADDADRIAELGSDIPYNTALNGIHSVLVNTYICPLTSNTTGCTLSNTNPSNTPDAITASVIFSDAPEITANTNPFQVSSGFLPTPSSSASEYNALSNSFSNTTNVTRFDGTVYGGQPINLLVLLPASTQNDLDLRLETDYTNLTVRALDTLGDLLPGVQALNWPDVAASVIYTTKNVYDDGCGLTGLCSRMPACSSILGCDGFSLPSVILQQLRPANGYQFELSYRVGLPNPDGSVASARRKLLALTTTSVDTYIGHALFRIQIVTNTTGGTGGDPVVVVTNVSVTVPFEASTGRYAFYAGLVPSFATTVFAYFAISSWARFSNLQNK